MADVAETTAPPAAGKKGKAAGKPKKAKTAPTHPKVSEMVNAAIGNLKERGGSSLQAIKKYVASHYKVDIEKLSPFLKKYLKTAVASGALVQTKGKGATGSFRLSAAAAPKEKKAGAKAATKESAAKKKPAAAKKPKAAPKKPAAKPKKAAAPKKKATPKKAAPAKKAAVKAAKSTPKKSAKAVSKTKSPKPKKSPAKKAAKKAKK